MTISGVIAVLTILGALGAVLLRNLIHCALALAVALAGLAAMYLRLNAQFAGFAQVLVYVGAVAVLILFAALMTRGGQPSGGRLFAPGLGLSIGVATILLCVIIGALFSSAMWPAPSPEVPSAPVSQIAERLMSTYVLPLQAVGLVLTAALIGAVLIAMRRSQGRTARATEVHNDIAESR